ncbi:hypothetical protein BJX96DRAFT_26458 [Aspergillus floccosus]
MRFTTVLAALALQGLVSATPVEALEKRDCSAGETRFCCDGFTPSIIFFLRGVGIGCIVPPGGSPCGAGKRPPREVCCSNYFPLNNGKLICVA